MTKEEIKDLISAKIAGQGNQVDSGGALDAILNAIVDAIPEGGGGAAAAEVIQIEMGEFDEAIAAAANYVQNHEVPDLVIIDVLDDDKFLVANKEYMFRCSGLASNYGD